MSLLSWFSELAGALFGAPETAQELEDVAAEAEWALSSGDIMEAEAALERLEDVANYLGIDDVYSLSETDMDALQEIVLESGEGVAPADPAAYHHFAEWIEENFPDAAPSEIEDAAELYKGLAEGDDIEVAAVFASIGEALEYVEGVSEGVLHIEAMDGYVMVIRSYVKVAGRGQQDDSRG